MPLPKIDRPLFELTVPSTGKKVLARPFSVREEKILLIAKETKDLEQAVLSIKQVAQNCLVDVDVEELAMFDLEHILLSLRSRSVDNFVAFSVIDPDTDEQVDLSLDIDQVTLVTSPEHTREIQVSDEFILYLKYPTISEFLEFMRAQQRARDIRFSSESEDEPSKIIAEATFRILLRCMDKLVGVAGEVAGAVYFFKDFSEEETDAFVDDLDASCMGKLEKFFTTMPVLRHEIPYVNSRGEERAFVLQGIESFFI